MLGWFAKLPGLGHLWFVTMIMACYVMFSVLRQYPEKFRKIWLWLLCIPLSIMLEATGLPGYFFLIIMCSGLGFIYARDIIRLLGKANALPVVAIAVIINLSVVYLLKFSTIGSWSLLYYYATACSGLSLFCALYKLFEKSNHIVTLCWISSLSYEIYLIHHPLCIGPLNLFGMLPNLPSLVIVLLILAARFVGALMLHKLAEFISKILQKASI